MPNYTAREAIELRLKRFITYFASFLAAMLLYRSIVKTIEMYEGNNVRTMWIVTLVAFVLCIGLLTIISLADPSDEEV